MKKQSRSAFGKRIDKKLIDFNMTHKELAEQAGVTRQEIHDLIVGRLSEFGPTAQKIKEILKIR